MDTSSTSSGTIVSLIRKFGAERVMFATDAERMLPEELFKWGRLPITDGQREQCMWKTAAAVFKLPLGE
jgi:predicted TIM-barrel fold metal-dependent hydrolase